MNMPYPVHAPVLLQQVLFISFLQDFSKKKKKKKSPMGPN